MRVTILILIVLLFSCSSIDRRGDIENANLIIGKSTKQDVINSIGLPNKVEIKEGNEFWIYSGKELNSDFFIPLPVGAKKVSSNTYRVYFADIGHEIKYDFEPICVCVFNKEMVLINAFDPR
ncbi:MAG: hypothetical protein K8R28_04965 [Desulfobacterales bacterium]|nr:hypothetical protein [Desulfobacterales bacterium]